MEYANFDTWRHIFIILISPMGYLLYVINTSFFLLLFHFFSLCCFLSPKKKKSLQMVYKAVGRKRIWCMIRGGSTLVSIWIVLHCWLWRELDINSMSIILTICSIVREKRVCAVKIALWESIEKNVVKCSLYERNNFAIFILSLSPNPSV